MLRRVVVPVLLALLIVGEVVTAGMGAADIRADRRAAAAAEAERKAVATYKRQLQPLALVVFDAVQPIQDVDDSFRTITTGQALAAIDVLRHSGSAGALSGVATRLKALKAPKSLAAQAKALDTALAKLRSSSAAVTAATRAKADRYGFVGAFGRAYQQLYRAEGDWGTALRKLYGKAVPPVPSADRSQAKGRRAPTHGGFISASDLICAKAAEDLDATGEVDTLEQLIREFPRRAALLRSGTAKLLAVKAPDAAFLHRLRVKLQATQEFPAALDAMATAARRADPAAYEAALRRFDATLPAMRDVSRAYDGYGAKVCGSYWNVDDLLSPEGSGGLNT